MAVKLSNGTVLVATKEPGKVTTQPNSKTTDLFRGYPHNIFERILGYIARGETLTDACRRKGMPDEIAVRKRLAVNADMKARYEAAVEMRYDMLIESIVGIADSALDGVKGASPADHLRHKQMRIDARVRAAEKVRPNKYGKGNTGEGGGTVVVLGSMRGEGNAPLNMNVGVTVKGGSDAT
jgi:hypothetical protein